MRFQKFMQCNMIRSTKSQKTSILRYSLDNFARRKTKGKNTSKSLPRMYQKWDSITLYKKI